ncbi:MAG: SGNH/GDSL hydrolase family protein, partial [candidate division Zixibacteria bacterium]|nr:SGNH/GDSL hydrolase family protein [candidate division Zixibacteria bacterium]
NDSTSEAVSYLDSALQSDYFSLRIKDEYKFIINQLSEHENVLVIDLPSVFRDNDNEKLFIDHCHPTEMGHKIIADEIFKVLKFEFRL